MVLQHLSRTAVILALAPVLMGTCSNAQQNSAPAGTFYDKHLDVHFNYPVEMQIYDAKAAIESGHEAIYGAPGNTDPEHREAMKCMRPLLDLQLPKEKAPQRDGDLGNMWVDDTEAYKASRKPEPISATIFLAEFNRDCAPRNLKDDDLLGTIALSAVSEPGIQRMPKPLWYQIGKQKIHMNSGVGRVLINGQPAPAPIIVMAMATKWRGHFLAWVFTSNDAEIFNVMTKSLVQFGNGPWGQMFPANIGPTGSGKPLSILPK